MTRTTTLPGRTIAAAILLLVGSHATVALGGAPSNDGCNQNAPISDGTTAFSTIGATTDGLPHAACGADPQTYNDIWFRHLTSQAGNLTVTVCDAADFDTKIVLYAQSVCPPTDDFVIACRDDSPCCSGGTTSVTIAVDAGEFLRIRLGGAFDGSVGTGMITLTYDPQPMPPSNNECAAALPIAEGATPFDTTCATTDGVTLAGFCDPGPNGDDQVHNDIWYTFDAVCTGDLTVSTCDAADFDTRLAVYDGAACPDDPATVLACNDDGAACAGGTSELSVPVVGGSTYLIRVGGGVDGATGAGTLTLDYDPQPDPPVNDDCAAALPILEGDTPFETTCATTDGTTLAGFCDPGPNGDDQVHRDIWYTFEAPCAGDLTVSTCDAADFDTRLAVYDGAACPDDPATVLACNDDGAACAGGTSELTVPVSAGNTYLIRVGGAEDGAVGTGTLTIGYDQPPAPPANDDCAAALPIGAGSTPFETFCSTTDGATLAGFCDPGPSGDDQVHNDVWFTYEAACTGDLTVSTCGTADFDTRLAVYDGAACPDDPATVLGCNDDDPGCAGGTSEVTVFVVAGSTYLIRVGGAADGVTGSGTLQIDCVQTFFPPANDDCADAIEILEAATPVPFDTTDASTTGAALDGFCSFGGGDNQVHNDIWYRWSATCDAMLTISTCGDASFDTRLAVYTDNGCPAAAADVLECNDDGGGLAGGASELTIATAAGTTYLIRVGAATDVVTGTGALTLTTSTGGPPTLALRNPEATSAMAGQQITVDLRMSGLCDHDAAGFQAFVEFDPARLQLEPGMSAYPTEPFGQPILPIIAAGGAIDLAAGINQPAGQLIETKNDAVVARLVFTLLQEGCSPEVTFRDHDPPSGITDIGGTPQLPLILDDGAASTCEGDTNGDGLVNIDDIVNVVLAFGTDACAADVNNDGAVDIDDIVVVVIAFGPCS